MMVHAKKADYSFSFSRDFMWNSISGSIPKEVGNITSLELL
jgi:hypothetical protein